ncbi:MULTISPECIES: TRAP transporter permease [Enterocloster]|uniref:TRAP transporter, 4TM/12TM fusion protein n=1 Tax=Enterocloster lavalensis TaxID=460384 RepID=A0A1I0F9Z6_9FIRM|nr:MULTISPECIES: TRAP transporter permease [Enterocloster]MDR3758032.1 TRAP transporter permease [Enterocloster sp.]PST33154.1 C4-dicarboxylate ABC transporter [Enterocloster lavalensis]SET54849.1 TRAP transporter, 4TM/12TM fusion protein [Enterocloster lavalensis]
MLKRLSFALAVLFCIFHCWTAMFGAAAGIGQKAIHLGLVLIIFFLDYLAQEDRKWYCRVMDAFFILASAGSLIYIMSIDKTIDLRSGMIYTYDILFGVLLIITLIEATRRAVGKSLAIVVVCFIVYGFMGQHMPGFLAHVGMDITRITSVVYLGTDGIYGTAIYASASYIVLFVILGAVFNETGVGDYFTKLASRAFGKFRGGPAKIAVVASGLFGSISGSAIANVIGTGTFTIPMMKKCGFEDEYAAAVEASASTGGQIMPPVMGATAFLIAEYLGIPYFDLVKAALIPAVLFYVAILMTVDLYARKNNIKGVPESELPTWKELVKNVYLILPLIYLIVSMSVFKMSVTKSGITSIIATIVCTLFSARNRITPDKLKKIVKASINGAKPVAIACGVVGIIIGIVMGSGLGFRMSSVLIQVSNGHLGILLVLTMVVSLILGMGVPTTAAYLMLALLVVPALKQMNVLPLAAHLFIFYFGIISNVTPPVALAAYAAAGVARCNPTRTGVFAFKLSLSGFILPFMFVYNPVLLMQGGALEIIQSLITALLGIYSLSAALEKFVFKWNINRAERLVLLASALLLIIPGTITDLIGFAVLLGIFLIKTAEEKKGNYAKA